MIQGQINDANLRSHLFHSQGTWCPWMSHSLRHISWELKQQRDLLYESLLAPNRPSARSIPPGHRCHGPLLGGIPNTLKHMSSSSGMIIHNRWENKNCSKPPTSHDLCFFGVRFWMYGGASCPPSVSFGTHGNDAKVGNTSFWVAYAWHIPTPKMAIAHQTFRQDLWIYT